MCRGCAPSFVDGEGESMRGELVIVAIAVDLTAVGVVALVMAILSIGDGGSVKGEGEKC